MGSIVMVTPLFVTGYWWTGYLLLVDWLSVENQFTNNQSQLPYYNQAVSYR
ncbi:hypothetical protein GCM10027035_07530 [Emticicia sediminis]